MNVTEPLSLNAANTPESPAVLTPTASLSLGGLDRAVSGAAGSFGKAGLSPGDIVAIDLADPLRHLVASLALARLAVGQVVFDGADRPELRLHIADRLDIAAVVSDSPAARLGDIPLIDPSPAEPHAFGRPDPATERPADCDDLPFMILRTSGTSSGTPKLAVLTHAMARPRIAAKGFGLPEGRGVRYLSLGSLNLNSIKLRAFHCLLSGGCLVFHDGADDPQSLVDFVTRHGIDYLSCSPHRASSLLRIAPVDGLLLPGIKALRIGSAFVAQPLRDDIRKRLTPNLHIAYGITETGTVSIAPPDMVRDIPGTVGTPLPGVTAEIVDGNDRPVPPGADGRLRLKSPGMIAGYLDSPAETARAFRNGWFYSDDRVEITGTGALIHHGRLDDMMICDGINISPAEIETVLLRHPVVSEAAAFSITDADSGDIPLAAVVCSSAVAEEVLLTYSRDRLGPHAPRGAMVLTTLPRNAAGKVLKKELRKLWRAKSGRP